MFWMLLAIIILVIGLMNVKKINKMFDKPTVEELEVFQESVFLHIDNEISKYKKEITTFYNNEGKPTIDEIKGLLMELDARIDDLKDIEKRLDEKIIKYDNFKRML